MIASMMAKRAVKSGWAMMSEDHIDTDALLKQWADDAVFDTPSDIGVGQTIKGKKAIADWFNKWEQEFPKRQLIPKNVCLNGTCLPSPNLITMVQWTCIETDKQGREYKYDGVSVMHMKNMKVVRVTEHISFTGLAPIASLIQPPNKP